MVFSCFFGNKDNKGNKGNKGKSEEIFDDPGNLWTMWQLNGNRGSSPSRSKRSKRSKPPALETIPEAAAEGVLTAANVKLEDSARVRAEVGEILNAIGTILEGIKALAKIKTGHAPSDSVARFANEWCLRHLLVLNGLLPRKLQATGFKLYSTGIMVTINGKSREFWTGGTGISEHLHYAAMCICREFAIEQKCDMETMRSEMLQDIRVYVGQKNDTKAKMTKVLREIASKVKTVNF